MAGALLWIASSAWAALLAARTKRSLLGFFVLSLLLIPLVGFLAALISRHR